MTGPLLTSPTDPLEVLAEQSVASIRRHVTRLHAEVARWEPRPLPAYYVERDYARPIRRGWAR